MRCFTALVAIAAAACGGSDLTLPNESVAANIAIVKGDHQSAAVGGALPDSLVVRVTDSRNLPVANQPVAFAVVAGGGSISPASTTTNSDGIARALWVLGPSAGAQQATAKPTGNGAPATLSATFSATATASAAAKIEAVAGNNQTSPAGSSVPTDPTVKVTDSRGNPVGGASVTFLVTGGGGAVNPTTPVSTGASGLASVSWTLGPQVGANTLSASVSGTNVAGNPVIFTATGAAGSAGKLAIVTQPPATGQSGVALSPAPSVQLQDANGNAVKQSGVSILADIASGPSGASIAGVSATTNKQGLATFANLVLTGPAGQYTISFNGTNLTGTISTPTTLAAGGAARLAVLVPPSATALSGVPFAQQPQIELRDAAGNPVAQAGVSVLVTISDQPASGGSLGGGSTTVQTGADGVARFSGLSISGAAGQYTLLFASGNLSSATAVVTIGAGSVSGSQSSFSLSPGTITASNGSSAAIVTITARDGAGNPVQGAAASVAVSGSNTVSTPAPTGADGKTTATLSSTEAGTKTVTVTINGTPVTNPSSASLVVSPAAPSSATSTTVPSPMSPVVGQTALITVTVKDAFGNPIPGRSVSLSSGGGAQITQPSSSTNSTGVTTGSVTYPTAGNKGLTAMVSGDGSLAQITITVAKGSTTVSLQTSPNPSNTLQQVTLTATVAVTAPAAGTPTGSVQFLDNGSQIGSDNLDGSGVATIQHTFILGDHPLTARYVGNASFEESTSATVTQHVNLANLAPTAVNDTYSTPQDVTLNVSAQTGVLANDTDPNSDPLTAVLDGGPSNGVLTLSPDGSFTYAPTTGFTGQDSFTYHASDGTLTSNSATVTINVNAPGP